MNMIWITRGAEEKRAKKKERMYKELEKKKV